MESRRIGVQVHPLVPRLWSDALQGTRAELYGVGPSACSSKSSFSFPGFPVMCSEVFLSDPLLPCGQHVPLYLSEDPEQVSIPLALASSQPSCMGLGGDTAPSFFFRWWAL